jgi:hypothetical protein
MHIIENVFGLLDDGPLARALSTMYVKDIQDVIVMPFEDVESLVYTIQYNSEIRIVIPILSLIWTLETPGPDLAVVRLVALATVCLYQ